jgi:hypothetical protein
VIPYGEEEGERGGDRQRQHGGEVASYRQEEEGGGFGSVIVGRGSYMHGKQHQSALPRLANERVTRGDIAYDRRAAHDGVFQI